MFELKSYNKLLHLYGKENLFDFKNEDHIFVIAGYPHWRAYILKTNNLKLLINLFHLSILHEKVHVKVSDHPEVFHLRLKDI